MRSISVQTETEDVERSSLKKYFIFLYGQMFSILGSSVVFFSIIWWITIESQSVMLLSIAATLSFLPNLILIPFAGVLADIWDKKKIILITDLLQAVTTFFVILSFSFGSSNIWVMIIMNSLRGFFQSFHQPAANAVIPLMVPKDKLTRINGLTNMLGGMIRITGPLIGAFLLVFLPISQILWVDIITFVINALFLLSVPIPKCKEKIRKTKTEKKSSFWMEFRLGFKTMKRIPGIFTLSLLCTFINFLLIPVEILMPYFINVVHHGFQGNMAFVMGMFQTGMILGSFIVSVKKKWKNRQKVVLTTGILMFAGNLLSALSPSGNFLIMGLGKLIFGINISIMIALYYTILQISVPLEQQGRIFSIDMAISYAITPIAMILAGPLADFFGIVNFFMVCGVLGIIAHIVIWVFTGLVSVDYDEIAAKEELTFR